MFFKNHVYEYMNVYASVLLVESAKQIFVHIQDTKKKDHMIQVKQIL